MDRNCHVAALPFSLKQKSVGATGKDLPEVSSPSSVVKFRRESHGIPMRAVQIQIASPVGRAKLSHYRLLDFLSPPANAGGGKVSYGNVACWSVGTEYRGGGCLS